MVPFWLPALWIGVTLWVLPGAPWATLLGYHGLCLLAASQAPRASIGRIPSLAWAGMGTALLAVPFLVHARPLPLAGAQTFLAGWPGGFPSYVAYTLTLNSICEELYWRQALPALKPGWNGWQHGAAFGLHHFVANGLVFGLAAAPIAFLYTMVGGRVAMWARERTGGVLLPMLGHSVINALSFAWMWGALRPA